MRRGGHEEVAKAETLHRHERGRESPSSSSCSREREREGREGKVEKR